jgi:2-amino-4-hydroxy-6-hydroxymethyldihydropteridine diphosphokinase
VTRQLPHPALPDWAHVTERRRAHIDRVVTLLATWADRMELPNDEATRWLAAGVLHDALRDAPLAMLRALTGDGSMSQDLLHGPAAAVRAEQDGERRQDVLEAVRFHTVGSTTWNQTGKALYMADFLEPGRSFLTTERAFIAEHVPQDFDGAFRQCVRLKLEWSLSQGGELFSQSVDLWNSVRSGA